MDDTQDRSLDQSQFGHHRRVASVSPEDLGISTTERNLDEFLQEESRIKRTKVRKLRSRQKSMEPEISVEICERLRERETEEEVPFRPEESSPAVLKRELHVQQRPLVLPNFKSQPFGAHQSYNSFIAIRDQFLYQADDWTKKKALRLRKPKTRKVKRRPVFMSLPPIGEHKVTAKLALKNFYLLKRQGFAKLAMKLGE